MRNRIGGLLALVVLIAPLAVFAAPPQQPNSHTLQDDLQGVKALTAEQLVAAVLTRNPGLQSLAAAAEAANYRIAPAGALDDPMLTYAGAPETAGGPRGFQERVELSQSLPWPGKLGLREDAARARAEGEEQSLADGRLALMAAAKGLFAEWAYIHRTLQIKHTHRDLLIELRRVAETQYAAGRARQQDVLQAEVEAARIDTDIVTHQRRKREVQTMLNGLLNRPPQNPLPPPALLPAPDEPPTLQALQETALEEHPALRRIQARIAEARARHGLAEKDYFPDFRLSAGYNALWDAADKRWMVGLSINLPFDLSGKRSATRNAAEAEVMRYQWQLTDREAQLLAQLEQGRAQVQETRDIVAIHRQRLLPLAEESLNAAVADYRAGQGSFLAVIDAERQQLRTEDNLARAHADYLRALAALERAAGRSLDNARPIPANQAPAGPAGDSHEQE
ncbi:MAG: transporter [Porticoccus sp.]|uniref:TolC family protein n=1 Tax=Porticoccus hydrocarbonoclasticus TaxID=1073414 RepID=UPI000C512BCC|nr:TolC family protein [Porticoccus hydrocarbonoclasticus]MBG56927.1 transporter [Porticoccus sp.]|tara:strand:- start:5414 stop:6766 length:1353 start_codon:yes stop_codon:yes gene_type:complete